MSDDIYSNFFSQSISPLPEEKVYYIIYQTTNLVNQKIYVGKHVTKNLQDGYLGLGKLLHQAILKYGIEHFHREILMECSSLEELNQAESQIVTPEFVAREDTYNMALGGHGGWYHVNSSDHPNNKFRGRRHSDTTKEKISQKLSGRPGQTNPISDDGRRRIGDASRKRLTGVKRSEETKRKISNTQRGKTRSIEYIETLRKNIALARQNKPAVVSEETKKRTSESLKKAWTEGKRQKKDYSFLQADINAGLSNSDIERKNKLWRGAVRCALAKGHIYRP